MSMREADEAGSPGRTKTCDPAVDPGERAGAPAGGEDGAPTLADQPPEPGTLLRIHEGFVDLFAQPVERATGWEGRPLHLLRIGPGAVLLGMAERPGLRLLAVPSLDADASPCALGDFMRTLDAATMLDAWCRALAAHLPAADGRSARSPRLATIVPEGADAPMAGGAGPRWRDDPARLMRGLEALHAAVLDAAALAVERDAASQRDRLARRRRAEREQFASALGTLGGVLDPASDDADAAAPPADDPCRAAIGIVLSLIGRADSTAPVLAAVPDEASIDRVERLAAACHLRGRRVLLVGAWWRRDRGVLIGFRTDEAQTPLVLRPARARGYDALGPDGRATPLAERAAGMLRVDAIQVYRSFAPGPVGLRQLLDLSGTVLRATGTTLVVMAVLTGALALAPPLAIAFLFDTVLPHAEFGTLLTVAAGVGVVAVGMACFELTKAIALIRLENGIGLAVQAALIDRLLRLPVRFFSAYASGDLVDRMLGVTEIRRALAGPGVLLLLELLFSGFSLAFLVVVSPLLAALAGVLLLATFVVALVLNLGALRAETAGMAERGTLEGFTVQLALGIAKLRVAAAEHRAMSAWSAIFTRQQRHLRSGQSYRVGLQVMAAALPSVGLIVLFAGATLATREGGAGLTAGSFMAFNAAFGALLGVVLAISTQSIEILRGIPLYKRARPLLAAAMEPAREGARIVAPTGRIDLHDLRFRYAPGGPPVLDGLSLQIASGEYLAIVGPSGSGKSTLFRLLLGFETAESGAILFDGVPQDHLDLATLRRGMGIVLQQNRISPGNLFQNIVGSSGLGLDDAWRAARLAGLADDIEALPMGMHTTMMEGGQGLSGGQRQRLLIARALVHRPRIVLFDEATSALDNRTQDIVTATVAGLDATRIVIAHRLSTIERADRVAVLQRGSLVQLGRFADLMNAPGPFRELARRQLL